MTMRRPLYRTVPLPTSCLGMTVRTLLDVNVRIAELTTVGRAVSLTRVSRPSTIISLPFFEYRERCSGVRVSFRRSRNASVFGLNNGGRFFSGRKVFGCWGRGLVNEAQVGSCSCPHASLAAVWWRKTTGWLMCRANQARNTETDWQRFCCQ